MLLFLLRACITYVIGATPMGSNLKLRSSVMKLLARSITNYRQVASSITPPQLKAGLHKNVTLGRLKTTLSGLARSGKKIL